MIKWRQNYRLNELCVLGSNHENQLMEGVDFIVSDARNGQSRSACLNSL